MVKITLEMIAIIDKTKFPSNIVKEYYEIIRELATVVLLLDGYKIRGEGAHKRLIEYLAKNYKEMLGAETALMEELRVIRNKITYDGFFITEDYLDRKRNSIEVIIGKLEKIAEKKLYE